MDASTPRSRPARRGYSLWSIFATLVAAQVVILGAFALYFYPLA